MNKPIGGGKSGLSRYLKRIFSGPINTIVPISGFDKNSGVSKIVWFNRAPKDSGFDYRVMDANGDELSQSLVTYPGDAFSLEGDWVFTDMRD